MSTKIKFCPLYIYRPKIIKPYSKYIEDNFFVDWIYKPTPESDVYWETYLLKNPQERKIISDLKEILLAIKTGDENLTEIEKEEMLKILLDKMDYSKKPTREFNFVKKYFKYAALLFVMLAISMFFINKDDKTSKALVKDLEILSLDSITNTQLVLKSGEPFLINKEESKIKYTNAGNIIVNANDTINSVTNENQLEETYNKLLVPYGKRSKITLSDGSVVHLNAGTKFIFPEKFLLKERTVILSGEAFFEVKPDKEHPFIVKTMEENFSIEVLGTKFNISAYPTDGYIFTALTEGKVNVVENGFLNNKKTVLQPGQLATWYKNEEKVEVKEVDAYKYTLWTLGLLHFESESVINVIRKIERFYNINIELDEKLDVYKFKISGKLDLNDKIEKTLENLMFITKFKIEKRNEKYILK
ncbi:FecR family protein [Algibacter pacificus]|uniref:FecR family protein n=1 Tax=Algibacter pacificus TaxID=2599389 RepID=UPI0011CB663E|nr:FecR domain-containing protein [Algibacter pacificus]